MGYGPYGSTVRGSLAKVCKHTEAARAKIVLFVLHRRYHDADYAQKPSTSMISCTDRFSKLADFCTQTSYGTVKQRRYVSTRLTKIPAKASNFAVKSHELTDHCLYA